MLKRKELQVKKSGLPKAGKGLFTLVPVRKGGLIVEYTGNISTWKEIKDDKEFNAYVFYITKHRVIDAKSVLKAIARYANDAKGISQVKGMTNNAVYAVTKNKVYIKATRPIFAGEEILVSYGKEYWQAIRENIKSSTKK